MLFHRSFTFSSYANKTGWLQNESWKNFFKKTFRDIFGQLYTRESKATKKVHSEASAEPWPPVRLFAIRGRQKRDFWFLKLLGTRLASAKWKEVKKSMDDQTRLMRWYWKRRPIWRKGLITYNSHPRIMFLFNWLVIMRKGGGFVWNWTSKVKKVEEFWT